VESFSTGIWILLSGGSKEIYCMMNNPSDNAEISAVEKEKQQQRHNEAMQYTKELLEQMICKKQDNSQDTK